MAIKLFMIADDLTGALDSGVKFAERGMRTFVAVNELGIIQALSKDPEVIVACSNSRAMPPTQAYDAVATISRIALQSGAYIIYKKVDSALRGNVGAELQALLDTFKGKSIHFVPAYPEMRRATRGATHYIDGVPLAESFFASDPITPVTDSFIPSLLGQQTSRSVSIIARQKLYLNVDLKPKNTIYLYDAETREDLHSIAALLEMKNAPILLSGCAAFAEEIAGLLSKSIKMPTDLPRSTIGIVLCGSLNQVSQEQIRYAVAHGAENYHLTQNMRLNPDFWESSDGHQWAEHIISEAREHLVVIDSIDPKELAFSRVDSSMKNTVAMSMGALAKQLISHEPNGLYLIIGGDTVDGFVRQVGASLLVPICDILLGAVLVKITVADHSVYVITKSGGLCERTALTKIFSHFVYT